MPFESIRQLLAGPVPVSLGRKTYVAKQLLLALRVTRQHWVSRCGLWVRFSKAGNIKVCHRGDWMDATEAEITLLYEYAQTVDYTNWNGQLAVLTS